MLRLYEKETVRAMIPLHASRRHRDTNSPIIGSKITLPGQMFIANNKFLGFFDLGLDEEEERMFSGEEVTLCG